MKRIRRRRHAGWKMPENARYIGRPSRWGNPYQVQTRRAGPGRRIYQIVDRRTGAPVGGDFDQRGAAAAVAARLYFEHAKGQLRQDPAWLEPLRGHDLACWCRIGEPCHGDILIALIHAYHPDDQEIKT